MRERYVRERERVRANCERAISKRERERVRANCERESEL